MEKIERRNYKSDFDAIIRLKDCRGNIVPFPDCDWEAVFWTSNRAVVYKASRRGGVYVNCFNDNGQIHVVFKHHRLSSGILKWEPHFELPNSIYPDGIQNLYEPEQLAIELVPGRGDCPATTDIEAMLPYIKFKYEDLTDAEKAELQQPATDAAQKLDAFVGAAEKAETHRVADETLRIAAEKARASQEAVRESAEAARQANEVEREEAEADREKAEENRAEEFAGFTRKIDGKMDGHYEDTEEVIEDIELNALEHAKYKVFIDMWENRCRFDGKDHYFGKYNRETGFFELNGITDITYEEALQIWTLSLHSQMPRNINSSPNQNLLGGTGGSSYTEYSKCRTYFPIISGGGYQVGNYSSLFAGNMVVETLNFVGGYGDSLKTDVNIEGTFDGCTKLRKVLCNIWRPKVNDSTFRRCENLEYIDIAPTINNNSFNFQWSPKLSFESLNLLVTQATFDIADTNHERSMIVTVHPDVYAKLTDETNTEWHQVLIDAATKNINFASV